jgi:uncharacterized protein YbbC (DUF1343 family)
LYPGLEILQAGGISVGRGTDRPFERIGAPWIRGDAFVKEMNRRAVPGARFVADQFTPNSGLYAGQVCEGARVIVSDRASFEPMRMGIEIAVALAKFYSGKFDVSKMMVLVGNAETIRKLKGGKATTEILAGWTEELESFRKVRAKYLLYQ